MYRVKVYFTDLQDNGRPYHPGDVFPRDGFSVSESRLKELSSENNKRRMPMIEYVPDEKPDKKQDEKPDTKLHGEEKPQRTKRTRK